jgi:hypothetical protein
VGMSLNGKWIVPKFRILVDDVEDVEAKTVHAFVQPKADGVEHGLFDFGVAVVQVWLEGQEARPEILSAFCVNSASRFRQSCFASYWALSRQMYQSAFGLSRESMIL